MLYVIPNQCKLSKVIGSEVSVITKKPMDNISSSTLQQFLNDNKLDQKQNL